MTPLAAALVERIRSEGPLPVSEVMGAALRTYYAGRDPFGAGGDFTTAPEISQLFGEMVGLWMAVTWQALGAPARVVLAEIGPGRGTLMADLLRAAQVLPPFRAALDVWLVENSPLLRERQARTLAGQPVQWAERIEDLPAGPLLLVANEFFDALPVDQYVKAEGQWCLRRVGLDAAGNPAFVVGEPGAPSLAPAVLAAPDGSLAEICPEGRRLAGVLGRRLAAEGGAALIVDYGHGRSAAGDTLQAVQRHRFHPVLADLGKADLTAHVDFEALAVAAMPARAWGPVPQGLFLRRLGIETRAAALAQGATAETAADIFERMRRLVETAEMGSLFKVMALAHPALPPPVALDPA